MTTPLEATARDMADKLNAYVGTQSDCYPLLLALMRQATEAIAREKSEAEAAAAVMRAALEAAMSCIVRHHDCSAVQNAGCFCPVCHLPDDSEPVQDMAAKALSSTAGASLLERLRKAEEALARIRDFPVHSEPVGAYKAIRI